MTPDPSPKPSRRFTVLLVHAHPDDECSSTGGLLIRCAWEGHRTVLVTCTNGEWGEDVRLVLRPRDREADRRLLADVRRRELEEAAAILGIAHLHPLGYRDSGMAGWQSNHDPETFANADMEEVVGKIVELIRRYRPDVLITYDEKGGYGHPDHVKAHRAAVLATEAAEDPSRFPEAGPAWRVPKVYYTAWARSRILRTWRWMRRFGRRTPLDEPDFREDRYGTPDHQITTRVDIRGCLRLKWRALSAHRSQIGGNFFWWFIRLTGRWLYPEETFVCARSERPIRDPERSIFEGL